MFRVLHFDGANHRSGTADGLMSMPSVTGFRSPIHLFGVHGVENRLIEEEKGCGSQQEEGPGRTKKGADLVFKWKNSTS